MKRKTTAHPPDPTLAHLLARRAEQHPERDLLTFLLDGEAREERVGWGRLAARADAVAATLVETTAPGEPVLLLLPTGPAFAAALLGCFRAGRVAVPAALPDHPREIQRLLGIFRDAGVRVALGTAEVISLAAGFAEQLPALGALTWIAVDTLPDARCDAPWPRADDLAILQYTSGSTGDPKGVAVTHKNLMANEAAIQAAFGHTEESRVVGWLPLFHDMGLMGNLLQPIYVGFPCVLMGPEHFLRRPRRWLEAVSRFQATTSGGPDFAYALCARKIGPEELDGLDLGSWRVAYSGAEPVRPSTLDRFAARFGPVGFKREAFYPCYGLAEATLFVTGVEAGQAPEIVAGRVSCGRPRGETRIAIVDPETGERREKGVAGEIWARGPSVAAGYWRRPEESEATFGAVIVGEPGRWLRTGDEGALHDQGLIITGRRKDVLVIRGQNHHAHDLEASLEQASPGLRPGGLAVFGFTRGGEERVAVAAELQSGDPAAVVTALRRALSERHGLAVSAVALLTPRTLPRTTSGKVRRGATREAWLAGSLETLHRWERLPDAEELALLVAAQLNLPLAAVDLDAPLSTLGLDSVGVMELVEALERRVGRRVSPAFLFANPTVRRLAAALGQEETAPAPEPTRSPASAARSPSPTDAIAVIGMAGRLPGAPTLDRLWELLTEGQLALTSRPGHPEEIGGFLPDLALFDPLFFQLSPAEARLVDPQQRLFLELGWEALEDAGRAGPELRGAAVGVFVGASQTGFREHLGPARASFDAVLGTGLAAIANRFSYTFDLRGPSVVVDTLCSSSLTALHQACQALRSGDCDLAVVGGVNTLLDPSYRAAMTHGGALSKTGRSRPFLAEADGFVSSEGAVAIVLKRNDDAERDGDRVRGLILASALNHNGRSNGLAAPNPDAQAAVVRRAWARSGRDPAEAALVEAHGTGTALGDPMEVQALAEVFLADSSRPGCTALGALKGNLGHLEAAAGLAGLAKVLLAMERGVIPPNVPQGAPNPRLGLEQTPFYLPDRPTPWTGARLAGLSSFGMGGANAHVVLAGAPPPQRRRAAPSASAHLLVLSAHTPAALAALVVDWTRWLDAAEEPDPGDLCWTAARGRTARRHRVALVFRDLEQLRDRLSLLRFAPVDLDLRRSGVWRAEIGAGSPTAEAEAAEALLAARAAAEPRAREAALRRVAEAWVLGIGVDPGALYEGEDRPRIPLPTTPFDRVVCWPDAAAAPLSAPESAAPPPLDVMATPTAAPPLDAAPTAVDVEALLLPLFTRELEIPAERLSPTQPFAELGVDSVRALRLLARFEAETGVTLPATLLFDWPDLRALSEGLVRHHPEAVAAAARAWGSADAGQSAPAPRVAPPPVTPLVTPIVTPTVAPAPRVSDREPIAIIGVSGRFPDAPTLDAYWDNLAAGHNAVREVPHARFDPTHLYRPDEDRPGTVVSRWGGFLDGLDQFDPLFFRLSPREAEQMDPQQRLILEVAWEAFEQAGYAGGQLAGSRTGVYIGGTYSHYSREHLDYYQSDAYASIGNSIALFSNRLSYFLDLQGPSMTVDTLCSSSLVALHLAVGALRRGECEVALVGGVHAGMGFGYYQGLSRLHAVSRKGACHTFSAEADGYIPGEGAGAIILKPLSRAVADGDLIWGLIRGSAVNHGGKGSGLTVPRASAQSALVRLALADSGVSADSLGYLEAHGTGTPLGDPIEIQALNAAFREDGGRRQFCGIGSVKSNLGHLEPAAGMAALIKVLMMMRHRTLPPTLHTERINPLLVFEDSPFFVCDRPREWVSQGGPRRAGVSGFGMGGANAHVIVEEAPPPGPTRAAAPRSAHALCVSARSEVALRAFAERLHDGVPLDAAIGDICWTANVGKATFPHRLAVLGADLQELRAGLAQAAAGGEGAGLIRGQARTHGKAAVVWIFPDVGELWPGVGAALLQSRAEVQDTMERARPAFEAALGVSPAALLRDVAHPLWADPGARAAALLAVELGMAALWERWVDLPAAVGGLGVGALAARVTAGLITVDEAIGRAVAMGRGAPLPPLPSAGRPRFPLLGEAECASPRLVAAGFGVVLEIGPAPGQHTPHPGLVTLPCGRRGGDGWEELLRAAAALWVRGARVDWGNIDRPHAIQKVHLPTVPYERQRYWRERRPIPGERPEGLAPSGPATAPPAVSAALDGPSSRRRTTAPPSAAPDPVAPSAALDRRGSRRAPSSPSTSGNPK